MSTVMILRDFQIVLPPQKVSQNQLRDWISQIHQQSEEMTSDAGSKEISESKSLIQKFFLRYGVKEYQVATRYFECDDMNKPSGAIADIYHVTAETPSGRDIQARNLYFSERAHSVFGQIYAEAEPKNRPEHLIHVTCTGYISPSAAQRRVTDPNWEKATAVTHAYHMGCYASLPSLRMARGFLLAEARQNPRFKVDLVHTEMCGLHMNPQLHTPEQIVVQTLFADGHIKYSATLQDSEASEKRTSSIEGTNFLQDSGFRVLNILEKIVPDTENAMSWMPTAWGMQMSLSREVPSHIQSQIHSFIAELLGTTSEESPDLSHIFFAIHPGGPKIIDLLQETLNLKENQVRHSREVLLERGNMSSATLPHVWQKILSDPSVSHNASIVSLAFGPGLTLFGAVLEVFR